jgi:bacterioferritin
VRGDPTVIQHLNAVLKTELTAINQYLLHARLLKNWGVSKLGAYEHQQSREEMKDADELIERILFLEGMPNLQDLDKLLIGETVRDILDCDFRLEQAGIARLREAITYSESVRDFGSRDLFVNILEGEEHQVEFLEIQLGLIEKIGLENYIQLQSGDAA